MRKRLPLLIPPISLVNVILFFALYSRVGGEVASLALIPVGAVGSMYGTIPGLLAALAAILANTLLFNLAGTPGWDAIVRENAVLGSVIAIAVGGLSGMVRHLDRALSRANAQVAAERERLQTELAGREEYMSVLAHELRNPLVGIRAAARVLGGRIPKRSAP